MKKQLFLEQTLQIQPGDHMVILYDKVEEAEHYLAGYIYASLQRNERCIYITGDIDTEKVLVKLEKNGKDLFYNGDLVVLNRDEAYAKGGKFNPDQMIRLLQEESDKAIQDGYTGLSVTGEISWVLDYEDGRDLIIEYEWKLNEYLFDRYPVSALCRYNMNKFSDEMIINLIQLHPFIIWKSMIHENPFYIPPEGYKNQQITKYQVQVWLENIRNFTNEKSRFQKAIDLKEKELEELNKQMTDGIIKAMIGLLSVHDAYTKNHSENVARLSKEFGEFLNLSEEKVSKLYFAGLVHDIGKTLIASDLLNKPGLLNQEEKSIIQMHPVYGSSALENAEKMEEIAHVVRHHHERWDGNGYPDRLEGESIPVFSRILALADTHDAMTNDRPYRKAFPIDDAINEIENCSGQQFDPKLTKAFVEFISKKGSI